MDAMFPEGVLNLLTIDNATSSTDLIKFPQEPCSLSSASSQVEAGGVGWRRWHCDKKYPGSLAV